MQEKNILNRTFTVDQFEILSQTITHSKYFFTTLFITLYMLHTRTIGILILL